MLAGLVALFAVVTAAPAAHAATPLVASNPAPKEQLQEQPGWVTLAFSRTIKKSVVKVLVLGSDGRNKVVGDLIYQGSSVMVQLDSALPKGTYTVKYQINRPDGQPEGGAFQFAYGKASWTSIDSSWSGTAEQPPEMANPDPMATGPVQTPTSTPPPVVVDDSPGSPSAPATTTDTPTASPVAPTSPASNPVLWIVLSGVAVVIVVGLGAWWLVARRRRS